MYPYEMYLENMGSESRICLRSGMRIWPHSREPGDTLYMQPTLQYLLVKKFCTLQIIMEMLVIAVMVANYISCLINNDYIYKLIL